MKKYIEEQLVVVGEGDVWDTDNKCKWYTIPNRDSKLINDHDITLLVHILTTSLYNEFKKIKKLKSYLGNIAVLFTKLSIPIT